jgi:5-methylcytosine-specific restriction endonuclease McrA
MKIKIDKADRVWSQYIRLRDGKCQRCGSLVRVNLETGLPNSHHCSHFWGRGKESTRFDPDNLDCLCYPCHNLWEKEERPKYIAFKKKQLGQKGYDALDLRAHTTQKRDRKMAYITGKKLLDKELKLFR